MSRSSERQRARLEPASATKVVRPELRPRVLGEFTCGNRPAVSVDVQESVLGANAIVLAGGEWLSRELYRDALRHTADRTAADIGAAVVYDENARTVTIFPTSVFRAESTTKYFLQGLGEAMCAPGSTPPRYGEMGEELA